MDHSFAVLQMLNAKTEIFTSPRLFVNFYRKPQCTVKSSYCIMYDDGQVLQSTSEQVSHIVQAGSIFYMKENGFQVKLIYDLRLKTI